jgi:hypothetical protein
MFSDLDPCEDEYIPDIKLPKTNASFDDWYDFYEKCTPQDRLAIRIYIQRLVNMINSYEYERENQPSNNGGSQNADNR